MTDKLSERAEQLAERLWLHECGAAPVDNLAQADYLFMRDEIQRAFESLNERRDDEWRKYLGYSKEHIETTTVECDEDFKIAVADSPVIVLARGAALAEAAERARGWLRLNCSQYPEMIESLMGELLSLDPGAAQALAGHDEELNTLIDNQRVALGEARIDINNLLALLMAHQENTKEYLESDDAAVLNNIEERWRTPSGRNWLMDHDAKKIQEGKDWEYRHHHDPDHECCVNCQLKRISHDAEIERRARLDEHMISCLRCRRPMQPSMEGPRDNGCGRRRELAAALAESQPSAKGERL